MMAYATAAVTATTLAAMTAIQINIANQYCGRRAVTSSTALLNMTGIEALAIVPKNDSRQGFRED
jgi:hypothetical protein